MNEEGQELLFDLLAKKAVYGLDESEQRQLDELDAGTAETEFRSLETTAAAISMVGLDTNEPLPAHLRSRIIDNASNYLTGGENVAEGPWPPPVKIREADNEIFALKPERSFSSWFSWAVAAAACIALAVNIFYSRFQPNIEVGNVNPPVETSKLMTPVQMRDEFMRNTPKMTKAMWAAGNVKEMTQISGDVVWSDEKQAGYMRFHGLPVNDAATTCYQLWIFDKTQDKATPIDGGAFDVTSEGEIIIPINAKLKAQGAYQFAITIERHGGVVVSKREKIAALAKVETQTS